MLYKSLVSFVILSSALSTNYLQSQETNDAITIKNLVVKSYLKPLYQEDDLSNIEEGFHEKFHMYVLYKGEFYIRNRTEWINTIKGVRERNLPEKVSTWEFNQIDVAGQTAIVKLTVYEEGKLKYIDYLTLYNFAGGWKVITKQFSMF